MHANWKFSAEREIWSEAVSIRIGVRQEDGGFAVAEPLTMRVIEPGAFVPPCVNMPFSAAQSLMDELWQAGCRPSQSIGTAGQVEAIKHHLEDMRKLVFTHGKGS